MLKPFSGVVADITSDIKSWELRVKLQAIVFCGFVPSLMIGSLLPEPLKQVVFALIILAAFLALLLVFTMMLSYDQQTS